MTEDDLSEQVWQAIEEARAAGAIYCPEFGLEMVCYGGLPIEKPTDELMQIKLIGKEGPWCVAAIFAGFRYDARSNAYVLYFD